MDDCGRSQINGWSKSEALEMAGSTPISVPLNKRQLSSIQKAADCQAGPESAAQLRRESSNKSSNAVKLCPESEDGKKLLAKKPDKKELKTYLKSLLTLTIMASEDPTSYATVSPLLKKRIASFKTIFGKYQTSAYCDYATYIYIKLLKTFQLYDPESVYDLCNDWRVMLSSFKSASRADAFIDCFKRFKQIVQHLQRAENRWTQLMILSILRLYTYDIVPQTVRALQSASGCDFLQVIHKIVKLPKNQETRLKSHNNLLTSINSENGSIHSFQPKKIVCNSEEYNLTAFELWIDWNVSTKIISFIVMSVTTDKSKDICGFTSVKRMGIFSRQNSLFVRSKWTLGTTRDNPKTSTIEISFLFSARIHSAILESDLRNVFIIESDNELAVAQFVEPKKKVTDDQLRTFSNIEIEKLPKSIQENRKHGTVETTSRFAEIQKVQDTQAISDSRSIIDVATSIAKTSDYFAQSSQCYDKNSTRNQLRKTYSKRRNHQKEDEPYLKKARTEPSKESLCANTIRSSTAKTELLTSNEQYPRPSVKKAIDVQEQNPRNQENIQLILVAADLIQKLTNIAPSGTTNGQNFDTNFDKNRAEEPNGMKIEKKERFESSTQQHPTQHEPKSNGLRRKFDENVWRQKWSIRKFFKTIPTKPHHVDEVEENIQNEDNDQMNIYYGSVSDIINYY